MLTTWKCIHRHSTLEYRDLWKRFISYLHQQQQQLKEMIGKRNLFGAFSHMKWQGPCVRFSLLIHSKIDHTFTRKNNTQNSRKKTQMWNSYFNVNTHTPMPVVFEDLYIQNFADFANKVWPYSKRIYIDDGTGTTANVSSLTEIMYLKHWERERERALSTNGRSQSINNYITFILFGIHLFILNAHKFYAIQRFHSINIVLDCFHAAFHNTQKNKWRLMQMIRVCWINTSWFLFAFLIFQMNSLSLSWRWFHFICDCWKHLPHSSMIISLNLFDLFLCWFGTKESGK